MNRSFAALLAILALALAARLYWFTGLVIGDDVVYSEIAVHFLDGDTRVLNVHAARLGFLFPLIASYAIFGVGELPLALPNLLCSLGTVALAFFIGRRLFSDAAGLLAAAILAVHPLLITYATEGHTDPSLAFWSALAMYAFLRAERPTHLALAGAIFGWSYLTKEATIALIPFFVGHWIVTKRRWTSYLPLALTAGAFVAAECVFYWIRHDDPFHRFALIRSQHTGYYMSAHYQTTASILVRMFLELPGRLFVPFGTIHLHATIHLAAVVAAVALRRNPGVRLLSGWTLSIYGTYCLLPSSLRPFLPGFNLYEWTLQVFALPLACILAAALATRPWTVLPIAAVALVGNIDRAPTFRRYAEGPREAYAQIKTEPIVTADFKTLEAFRFFDGHHPKREYRCYETEKPAGVLVVDRFWTTPGGWWSRPPPPKGGEILYPSERVTIYRVP